MSLTAVLKDLPEPLFSEYKIEKIIGCGAYAIVYQIRDLLTREDFALKVIEKEPVRIRHMYPQLIREATILQDQSDNPYVVQLLETTETDDHIFMRFEMCKTTLEDMCMPYGMSEDEALRWFKETCYGLQSLHEQGILHRDMKPANLLVGRDRHVRLCDFGWACEEDEDAHGVAGTPDYAPPETGFDNKGTIHSSKVDIYSLGGTLLHMLNGRPPTGPDDIPKGISKATRNLLRSLMKEDPLQRPSIEEVLDHPALQESIATQLWNQWTNIIRIPLYECSAH